MTGRTDTGKRTTFERDDSDGSEPLEAGQYVVVRVDDAGVSTLRGAVVGCPLRASERTALEAWAQVERLHELDS